jgi:hypothetical protein
MGGNAANRSTSENRDGFKGPNSATSGFNQIPKPTPSFDN